MRGLAVLLASWVTMGANADTMKLLLFNESYATQMGARCLDGSVAGAYYAEGDPARFLIYLEVTSPTPSGDVQRL
jgi:hypothetical protein